jgi:hypothetical protein
MTERLPVKHADPRNPQRPDGEAGANWAHCRRCARGAHHMRDIRHRKRCSLNRTSTTKEQA